MLKDFETTTYGKWILAGEHAVLRGHGALVFPIKEKYLRLRYSATNEQLTAHYEGESGNDNHSLFWSVIEKGLQLVGQPLEDTLGHFDLYSNIPVGVGMGASAALCVALARWFVAYQLISSDDLYEFAKKLEDLFHGKSSGLDIAGVAAPTGVYFQQGNWNQIKQAWNPKWYLSSCGQIGMTSRCIQQVTKIWENDKAHAAQIDVKMFECVLQARDALERNLPESKQQLADAINKAADCFYDWGLISDDLQQHMNELKNAGAIAMKPTGSGGGGYVVSLWNTNPTGLSKELISI
jgi:mevalonate kinase